ncbi:hypothetical protein IK112_02225 [Candidatus Saccharibacteria bacterium]|nr:hypothetical protein [Candidatus Saccharibacteria bacterium]
MSTTAQSDRGAYFLSVHSGGLVPQGNDSKTYSLPLRCVSTQARRYPLSYVYSGYYGWWDGNLDTQGSRGIFWSATTNGNAQAYRLSVWTDLDTLSISGMTQGNPLRFTLRPSVSAFVCIFWTICLCRRIWHIV